MRIVRYALGRNVSYGILEGETVRELAGSPFGKFEAIAHTHRLSDVRLLAPCRPSKIVALGVNYHSHSDEMQLKLPSEPLIFIKPATAVIGPDEAIVYPPSSNQVDYEGELGIVIKRKAHCINRQNIADYILGYTCFNDVTARDLQAKDKQWTRAKGFDTFAPIGPWIETDLDPNDLRLQTYLNGQLKQDSSTGELIFNALEVASFISHVMTLMPGDVIATGTPAGIGPMQPGDTVEVKIEGIGTLRNHVIAQDCLKASR